MTYDLHFPASPQEALDLLAQYGDDAAVMAGGTALVLLMRQGLLRPGHVVAVGRMPDLRGIAHDPDGWLWIGATATIHEAQTSPEVRSHCPALAEAFGRVATVRVRNQATVGGNLAHADPAQDPPPMLLALGAELAVLSRSGMRRVPLDGFFVDQFATALEPGELVTGVRVPPLALDTRATYVKFLPRTEDDYATVSVAAAVRIEDGHVADARVALGSVGPTPIRTRRVEEALRGTALGTGVPGGGARGAGVPGEGARGAGGPGAGARGGTADAIGEAAALVREEIDPIDDLRGSAAYKREMARVWTERALRSLVA